MEWSFAIALGWSLGEFLETSNSFQFRKSLREALTKLKKLMVFLLEKLGGGLYIIF